MNGSQIKTIDDVEQLVQIRILEAQQEILKNVFSTIKKKLHADKDWRKCNCSACCLMKEYVFLKIKFHHINRKVQNCEPFYPEDKQFLYGYSSWVVSRYDRIGMEMLHKNLSDKILATKKRVLEVLEGK
jgi:hypothetical protein